MHGRATCDDRRAIGLTGQKANGMLKKIGSAAFGMPQAGGRLRLKDAAASVFGCEAIERSSARAPA